MTESRAVTHDHGVLPSVEIPESSRPRGAERADLPAQAREAVLCGLNGHSARGAPAFAARLARRLGWRLSLSPVQLEAAATDQLDDLAAAAAREEAALVVTPHLGAPGWRDALIGLPRTSGLPLITVPQDASSSALGAGPILSGLDARGGQEPITRAARRIAAATGSRLQLLHVSARRSPGERHGPADDEFNGLMSRALDGLDVAMSVDVVIDEGDAANRLRRVAERDEAALLVLGAPREAISGRADEGRVAASLLRDLRIPMMIVPEPAGGHVLQHRAVRSLENVGVEAPVAS